MEQVHYTLPLHRMEDKFKGWVREVLAESKPEPKEKLTVKQASKELNVSEQSVYSYIKKGFLPAKKVGSKILILKEDIDAAIEDVKSLKYKRGISKCPTCGR